MMNKNITSSGQVCYNEAVFFVTDKNAEELKACFIVHGSEGHPQFLEKVIDSNKLCFGGVVLPPRFDDRVISRNIAPSMMSSKNYCQI